MAEGRSLRLLVVEDEGLLAMMLADMLEEFGHSVAQTVATVSMALAAVEVHAATIDGCILDANLGGQSAAPVAEALRHAGIPFIITTRYDAQELQRVGLEERAVSKPYNRRDLASALELLPAKSPRSANGQA